MSSLFVPAGRLVTPDVAAYLAPVLVRELERARRDRVSLPDDVVDAIEGLAIDADAWATERRNTIGTSNVPIVDTASSEGVEWVFVKDVAAMYAKSERAVTGLCGRGSLHAERHAGRWRICRASATARLEGSTCPHRR